jgi:hypothetical protein
MVVPANFTATIGSEKRRTMLALMERTGRAFVLQFGLIDTTAHFTLLTVKQCQWQGRTFDVGMLKKVHRGHFHSFAVAWDFLSEMNSITMVVSPLSMSCCPSDTGTMKVAIATSQVTEGD